MPDQSAEEYDEPVLEHCQALLLASFERRETIEQEIVNSILDWEKAAGITSEIPLIWLPHVGGRLLARATIDSLKFPDCVEHLDSLLTTWKELGGLTNWHDVVAYVE